MNSSEDLSGFDESDYDDPNFREIFFNYLRYWKWFVFSIIAFGLLGFIYVKLITPLYKIQSELLIKDNKGSVGGQNDLLKDLDLFTSDKIIDNEIQILKSKTILEKVIKSLKLQTSYYNKDGVSKNELYDNLPFEVQLLKPSPDVVYDNTFSLNLLDSTEGEFNGKRVRLNLPFKTEAGLVQIISKPYKGKFSKQLFIIKFNDLSDILQQYEENLKVDAVSKQGTVLVIDLEDAIPQRGIDFLDRLVLEYNQAALEDKNKVTSRTLSFIDDRISTIGAQLGASEKSVELYKSDKGIANIGVQSQILLQGVGDNDAQLSKINIQLEVLQNLENYLAKNNDQASNLPSMLGIDDPTLLGLVQQLGEAQQRRIAILQTAPESNPLVGALTDQINGLKEAINSSVQNFRRGLLITNEQLKAKNNHFENTIKEVPSKERGLLDVMRQQHLRDTLYTYLLQKREETAMNLASGVADSRTIDNARSSKYPVKPIKKVIYAIFILVGAILPIVCIYLKELLNYKVTKRSDIEKYTTIPILAEISHSKSVGTIDVVDKPRSIVSEQIRSIRTNLQFLLTQKDHKVILFTSSISGEGKSFVSLNLGASLAMAGNRVVILELDLRKPKLHEALNINSMQGLSNYLINNANYEDILIEIPVLKNYFIIPSGPIPPNPAELLGNGLLQNLLEKLKKDFDYIILDAPPVGLVTDAQILEHYGDATLFIVRHNYTAKNMIRALNTLYRTGKFKNLNIILNSIDIERAYGYNSYEYGYGGYYQEDKIVKDSFFKRKSDSGI